MKRDLSLEEIHVEIQAIKKSANKLKRQGDRLPAVSRNAIRILASTKMLELNISDMVEFHEVL